jgi:hypothetical protein
MVTVTVPPEAIVTLPANVLPLSAKLAVLALPLTALLMRAPVVVSCDGMVSLRLPLSVPGPALLTTSVKLVVVPTATVLLPTVLLVARLTTLVTVQPAPWPSCCPGWWCLQAPAPSGCWCSCRH